MTEANKDALTDMRRVRVEIEGVPATLVLGVPTAWYELPLLPRPGTHRTEEQYARLIIQGVTDSLDGQPVSRERAGGFAANPASRRALLGLRAALYDDERHAGRVHLACPHCARTSALDLTAFALALDHPLRPIADAAGLPVEPSLASLYTPAARPSGMSCAASARLELPSAVRGLVRPFSEALVRSPITLERHLAAVRRWLPADRPFDPMRAYWTATNPGFRALVNMTLALDELDGQRDVSPETLERMPMTDFAFVDAAYHFLYRVEVTDAERASVACPGCTKRFLLVLA